MTGTSFALVEIRDDSRHGYTYSFLVDFHSFDFLEAQVHDDESAIEHVVRIDSDLIDAWARIVETYPWPDARAEA